MLGVLNLPLSTIFLSDVGIVPTVWYLFCFFINPAVSEANMVDSCKHFEIGSGSVRSLSYLPVFAIEGATNMKQIK